MNEPDRRTEWPREWLAFELLRRHPDYRAAWAEYQASRASGLGDRHGWGRAFAKAVGSAAADPAAGACRPTAADFLAAAWSVRFGLQYMLDPDKDAADHEHIPWRPAQGPVRVAFVAGPENFVFDLERNPHWARGFRRFVAVRFDLGRPLEAQLAQAAWQLKAAQGAGVKASKGRSPFDIVKALNVLDRHERGATNAEIGKKFASSSADPANYGGKLVKRAKQLRNEWLAVALGSATPDK